MKTTVIYHSADFDGIFCREIARKFLPDAELIGWDYGNPELEFPKEGQVYVLDLSPGCFGEAPLRPAFLERLIWIDHHKSAIEKYPATIPGYRIDGVAACRLAWQWFSINQHNAQNVTNPALIVPFPDKQAFIDRAVTEPLAVRLAGEYDIWDKRDPRGEVFQFGLRSVAVSDCDWAGLLCNEEPYVQWLLERGALLQSYQQQNDAGVVKHRSFLVEFEGLKFLALTTARCNSLTFAAKDVPETGHDALMGFYWTGSKWSVSLYHAKHRTDLDLSTIAVKFGGGGHRGACGFRSAKLPFLP